MLRFALYCRKSDKDDGDTIKSIDDQRDYWISRAAEIGIIIKKVYEENMSAMVPNKRPIYDQMIRDLKAGIVDAILVWHISRLARNPQEAGEVAQLLVDGTVAEIRSPNSRYTPEDNILPLLLEQGSAVQQSRDLSRTMKHAHKQKVKNGGWPHRARIGYLNARDPLNMRRGIVVVDPERFPLVRRGMEMMLTGRYSMLEVIRSMNAWGLRTRPTEKKPSRELAYCTGYKLFADPFYAGFVKHCGDLSPGQHQPMLTPAEFQRLQVVCQRFKSARKVASGTTYTRLLRCGLCGYQVTGERRRKGGRTYVYYHCCDPKVRCSKRAITERALEAEIARILSDIRIDPEAATIARSALVDWVNQGATVYHRSYATQRARLAEVDRQRQTLVDLLVAGTVTDSNLYATTEAKLLAERSELQIGLAASQTDLRHVIDQADALLKFASNAAVAFAAAGPERKRAIAEALGVAYRLTNREVTVVVDPALEKIVAFAHQKTRSIEPGVDGSGSREAARFGAPIFCGATQVANVEPPDDLLQALQESTFPDLWPTISAE